MAGSARWMLYGATGYTGQILLEGVAERGLSPVIAGRSEHKLRPLAERYAVESVSFGLDDPAAVEAAIRDAGVDLVLHAAGPFTFTAEPVRRACINAGVHYLDITGEIDVFESTFAADSAAQEAGVLLMSGVGFDIVPSDCLSKYVADQVPDADQLDVAISAFGLTAGKMGTTPGTMKSMVEMMPSGCVTRRDGRLTHSRFGSIQGRFAFPTGDYAAMAIPWGDVSTAYRSTGIPNITAYIIAPKMTVHTSRLAGGLLQRLMQSERMRRWANRGIDRFIKGPGDTSRQSGRSTVYARATNRAGDMAEAWLETKDAYDFTVDAALNSVERVLAGSFAGALTPAQAFGADFALDVPTTNRYDTLDGVRRKT